jgi:hypothetical protein
MPEYISPEEFKRLIEEHCKFLQSDFGCVIEKITDWKYIAENSTTRILLLIEGNALTIGLEPIGEGANQLLRINIIPSSIEVVVISECLDPKFKYQLTLINGKEYMHDIPIEIKKRTKLLKNYCMNMLRGDFSEWPKIKNCISERRQRFYQSMKRS